MGLGGYQPGVYVPLKAIFLVSFFFFLYKEFKRLMLGIKFNQYCCAFVEFFRFYNYF